MNRVLASSSCQDGDCPTFWVDDATGMVTVRGYDAASPTGETDVTIPGPVWAHLVSQIPR